MTWLQTIVLGAIQGATEFLPISSSGHLRIFSELLFGNDAGASFTAVTQLGTEAAVLLYFAKDIGRIVAAWCRGLFDKAQRSNLDYRMGWYVIIGTIPVGVLGLLLADQIRTGARNLWLVATMLIVFALVIALAERIGSQRRRIEQMNLRDGLVMGSAQALALIPGVSRSGGTISAGLFLGLDRESAARYSFLLAIPAVLASGLFSSKTLDQTAAEDGVEQIVTESYGARSVSGVSCPSGQQVKKGDSFECSLTVDGTAKKVTVTFTDDDGTYEVGRPK